MEMLDEVVGHPTDLLLAVAREQQRATVHRIHRVIHDRQRLSLSKSIDRFGERFTAFDGEGPESRTLVGADLNRLLLSRRAQRE